MSYQGTVKNYERPAAGAGGGSSTAVGAYKIDAWTRGRWAVFPNFQALAAAYQTHRKPSAGYAAAVGTTSQGGTVVDTITAAYTWDATNNRWQPIATNFRGADGSPGRPGTNGLNGRGFNWKGEYNGLATYNTDDVVRYKLPASGALGLWLCKRDGVQGSVPTTTADWDFIIETDPAAVKPHTQFKCEAIWDTTPSQNQGMDTGTVITSLGIKWNIIERSATDESIATVNLSFDDSGRAPVNGIQSATNSYTYSPDITQPNLKNAVKATLTITSNKGNVVTLSHTFTWEHRWYKGYLNKATVDLTAADVQGSAFTVEERNTMPGSVRIQRSANTAARVFIVMEIPHLDLPDNFHLDLFPYLHKTNKSLTIGGRSYRVFASTQLTHANDLTVTAFYR